MLVWKRGREITSEDRWICGTVIVASIEGNPWKKGGCLSNPAEAYISPQNRIHDDDGTIRDRCQYNGKLPSRYHD